jgi:predicted P-loop ATPase
MRGNHIISCQHNALNWLAAHGYTDKISLDTFLQVIKVDGKPMTDELIIEMVRQMEASEGIRWTDTHIRTALINLGHRHASSSLITWLESLTWDGKDRIDLFFSKTYDTGYSNYTAACGYVLFLSAVARAYQPGCKADVMVVLIGDQGLGKSRGIEDLVPKQIWYTDDLGGDLYERKVGEGLQGKWIIEFSEFSRINRATIEVVKDFLSRRVDHFRPAYGRIPKDFPRQCVFVGTTNNPLPLQDTENRRYMPVECNTYRGTIPDQREQLWAEAVYRYKNHEPWWVTDEALLKTVKAKQDDARQHDEWEDVLRESLALYDQVNLSDVAAKLNIGMDRFEKAQQTRLGIVMKAIGFQRKREGTASALDKVRHHHWKRVPLTGGT